MRLEYRDWPYLRGAVAVLVGAVVFSAALLTGSAYFKSRMEQEYRRDSERLSALRQRALDVDEEERIIRDYLPRYVELQAAGLLRGERRLDWIEALQDAGAELRLPSLSYEISAQQAYHPKMAAPGKYTIFVSAMTLSMQLLHEDDLFALLALLDERARGLHAVSSCELTRNFVELADNPMAGNLSANCLLEWFSIKAGAELNA